MDKKEVIKEYIHAQIWKKNLMSWDLALFII